MSLDKAIRLWDIGQKSKPIDIQQTQDFITALDYLAPSGRKLVVGFATGQCSLYTCDDVGRLNYSTRIDCKNRRGKFSSGRRVSGVKFVGKGNEILISTNDSRLRLFNLDDYIQKYKYKGHKSENLPIEACVSENMDYIVSGSEDGNVYLWDCICDHVAPVVSAKVGGKLMTSAPFHKDDRIKSYEFFTPFSDEQPRIEVPVAIFAPNETVKLQQIKYHKLPNNDTNMVPSV